MSGEPKRAHLRNRLAKKARRMARLSARALVCRGRFTGKKARQRPAANAVGCRLAAIGHWMGATAARDRQRSPRQNGRRPGHADGPDQQARVPDRRIRE